MAEDFKDIIMAHIKRDILINSLKKGERFDERAWDEFRPIEIQKDVIKTAEGSALAKIGETQVLAGVKFEIETPFPDRPNEGILSVNADLLPLASSTFEIGPPDENAIELARVVDRTIRSSEAIDLKSLFIEEGKVLALYIDIYVLDHSGNFIDASTLAATAALTATKIPKVEDGNIIRTEYREMLKLRCIPVTTTFVKVGDYVLLDPTKDEEMAIDSRITIGTTKDHICAIQKSKGALTKKELADLLDVAFKKGDELRNILTQGLSN
jgi:exosome complex component RRP42